MPKQLLPLAGASNEPLIAATVRRLSPLIAPANVYVATGAALSKATRRALPKVPPTNILAEPAPRNTAPCIGWATHALLREDPDALIAVLPSDHFIGDEPGFRRAVETALRIARQDWLVTIGVVPTRAETGYGYVEVGPPLEGGAFQVERFVEKPDAVRAEAFVRGGRHLWNAGMFFFSARTMAAAIEKLMPDLHAGLVKIDAAARRGRERPALERLFPRFPAVSIDYGVMEKAERVAVVPGDFGWNDVGSWESAWELAPKDALSNAAPPGAALIDAERNVVWDARRKKTQRVYALLGVSDMVLVETDDAVLLMPRSRAQDVRKVVEELRRRGDEDLL
jgi:mannose-1-phosphate guanylyltransferase